MQIFVGTVGVLLVLGLIALFCYQYIQAKQEGVKPNFTSAILVIIAFAVSLYGFSMMQKQLSAESIAVFVLSAFFALAVWR